MSIENVIEVNHLVKRYDQFEAVKDISFQVQKGELFGFLGVNGAGKSTTINMLCTLLKPTGGNAIVAGCQLGKENEAIKRKIGVVYQHNVLDSLLTVEENLKLRGSMFTGKDVNLKNRMQEVTEILSLEEVYKRPYGKLSGGQKRRAEIAASLLHRPEILFLDEPTTGLDPATRVSVWETVEGLQKKLDMTVFLTTHYMEEAAKANHIAIMNRGSLVEYATPFELKESYAKDRLLIAAGDAFQMKSIREELAREGYQTAEKEGRIELTLSDTKQALDILGNIRDRIQGFEVLQGTMDDVFLNVEQKYNAS